MTASRSRRVALQVVTRVRERSAYAHETLDAVLRSSTLDARDAAFATRLAYGTIACRGTLDAAIERYVSRPGSVQPAVLDALALSAYEILFASTPSRAAVSEGVELVRSVKPGAAGFANAVLRRLSDDANLFPWGDSHTDVDALARRYGHPEWLTRMWVDELGSDAATRVLAADNEPAPLFLAHVPFADTFAEAMAELEADGAAPEACERSGCIRAGNASAAIHSGVVTQRRMLVADAGAQFAVAVARVRPGMSVVDIGAGRGTKSLLMASGAALSGESGPAPRILAVDTHAFKLETLAQDAAKLGVTGIETLVADATADTIEGMPADGTVDVVFIDAPCSGLGTLRRHPDRRWRATADEIETLALLGERLLARASRLVKPGGFVVYSTCTIARRENASVIEHFLGSEAGATFAIDPLGEEVPAAWAGFVTDFGTFQSLPERDGMDGHFVARLARLK